MLSSWRSISSILQADRASGILLLCFPCPFKWGFVPVGVVCVLSFARRAVPTIACDALNRHLVVRPPHPGLSFVRLDLASVTGVDGGVLEFSFSMISVRIAFRAPVVTGVLWAVG